MKQLSAALWIIQLFLLHSLLAPHAASAKVSKPLNEYAMRTWTTAHGLPHNSVNAITQSADGYLWLATWEGPVRYNGREFTVFDDIQVTQMPEAGALDINVHSYTGEMIVAGPRGGVVFFNGQQWQPFQFGSGYAYETVVDDLQRLWVASSAGVYRLDTNGEVEFFDVSKGLPDNTTIRIALVSGANNQQQVWAGTRAGLAVFEPSTGLFAKVNELPTAQIREIRQLHDGRVAVSSDDGLFIQQSTGEFKPWPVAVKGPITAIVEGPEGCLWVGTFEYGVGRLCADQQEWLSVDQGLPNSHVLDIFRDRENNMWVSTHGGFTQFRAALFTSFTPHHGLKGAYARSVHVDNEGTIWVGTNDGLSYRKNGRFIGLDKEARLQALSVLSIASDDANRLYVGSYTEGVLQLQDGRITAQLNRDNGLMLNEIRVVKPIPSSDYVLVGTPNGLYVTEVRNGQFVIVKHFTSADGMASDFVHSLTLAPNGDLWVSSTSTLTHFKTSNSRFDWKPEAVNLEEFTRARNIFSGIIHQQRLWLATDQGVLTRDLATGTWQWLGRQQGLPFEKIFTINFDTQANLWLGGSRGIIRVSAEQLEQWLSEEIKLVTHKLFSEADGMKSRQITTGGLASALDTEGHLWFASAVGAVRVDPSQYNAHENSAPPPVIESVTHDYGVLEATAELPADNTRTAFNYVALGYQMPEQIEYQVRMYGYDTQWINREDNLTTEYTALPPGNYRFAVRTRYQGENWSQPTEFSFSKAAYFYQRSWFWFIFSIALIAFVGGIVHWRIRQLEKMRVRLQAMVHQQTLELEQLALTDSLTGLANRRAFDQRLALEVKNSTRHQTPLSVGLLDLDYFKEINDKYLHAGGDIILTQVAKLIATNARETDLVARWGGEEFAIIFPDTTQAQAAKILERIRLMVEQLEVPEVSDEARVTVSIGLVSNQSAMSSDAQQLLKLADRMLYQAKEGGRNRLSIYQADDING